eukprot:GFYU01014577.1.p1 GENE.GFYU01014577.1~~GFYU01014577.1.p1  ORF type:complete len:149 (-),score=49.22 GFYU01014577.1:41-436(-)
MYSKDLRNGADPVTRCDSLSNMLELMGGKQMVVSGVLQDDINSDCDGKLWRVNTGLSQGISRPSSQIAVLQIKGEDFQPLTKLRSLFTAQPNQVEVVKEIEKNDDGSGQDSGSGSDLPPPSVSAGSGSGKH